MTGQSTFYRRLIPWISNPRGLAVDRWLVRATGRSLMGHAYLRAGGFALRPHLLLETIHWRSGLRRTVVLPYQEDAGRLLVVGSHGGRPTDPIWVHNLRTHPEVWVRPRDRRWRFASAHVAKDAERQRLWEAITAEGAYRSYERAAHPRVIPVVVITPVDPRAAIRPSEDRAPGS